MFKENNYHFHVRFVVTFKQLIFSRVFAGRNPELVVFDEELLSQIMVKEFASFTNRRVGVPDTLVYTVLYITLTLYQQKGTCNRYSGIQYYI